MKISYLGGMHMRKHGIVTRIGAAVISAVLVMSPMTAFATNTSTPTEPRKEEPAPAPAAPAKNIVNTSDETKKVSTVKGFYSESGLQGFAVTTPQAEFDKALGAEKKDSSRLLVRDSLCGELAKKSLEDAVAALQANIPELQLGPTIDYLAYVDGKNVAEAAEPIEFMAGVPDRLQQYDVAAVLVQPEGKITLLKDTDTDPKTFSSKTSGFGVMAFVYAPAGSIK